MRHDLANPEGTKQMPDRNPEHRPAPEAPAAAGPAMPMRIQLVLVDADRAGPVPPQHRLKRLLKTALRSFGLRCVECVEVAPEPSKPRGK